MTCITKFRKIDKKLNDVLNVKLKFRKRSKDDVGRCVFLELTSPSYINDMSVGIIHAKKTRTTSS